VTNSTTIIETATVQANITLTVTPAEGQTPEQASNEMFGLLKEYLTSREHPFLGDYGTTVEELNAYRTGETDERPTWGGYEGPYVLEASVSAIEGAA
jgi:hypothetical protein